MNKTAFTNFPICDNFLKTKHALMRSMVLVLVLFTSSISALYSQPPTGSTITFEDGAIRLLVASSSSPSAANIDGKALTVAVNNTSGNHLIAVNNTFATVTGGADLGVIATNVSGGVASYFTLKSDNNTHNWGVTSLHFGIALGAGQNVTVQGYDDGVAVSGTIVRALSAGPNNFALVSSDFTTAGGFTNIDEIRFTLLTPVPSDFAIDDVLLAAAVAANNAPTIGGTSAGQAVNDNATISPFSAITVADGDGDNVTATITLDNNAKGVITGADAGAGPYTMTSKTPAAMQTALRALVFNPTDNRTATSETTTFTVVVNDGTVDATNNTTTVISSAVAPTVTSVTVPSNATYIAGGNLDFTVNFSENVTVNTGGGTPQMSITIGATTRQAVYQSGSGSGALLFRYIIQAGELDTDGIAVGTLSANGGTLRDAGAKDATLTLNSVGVTTAVLVDAVAPTVTSVTVPSNATYLAGGNLDFTVNFSEN
uniref:hypothetical protein n=1 Tax=Roseivirga sp. TaxID=1964215 RepID=UPI004048057F